jgi:hypothetical protein
MPCWKYVSMRPRRRLPSGPEIPTKVLPVATACTPSSPRKRLSIWKKALAPPPSISLPRITKREAPSASATWLPFPAPPSSYRVQASPVL